MRLLLALCGISTLGCAFSNLAGRALGSAISAGIGVAVASTRYDADRDDDVAERMRLCRDQTIEQYDDPSAPPCHVEAHRTGPRTWEVRTCHERWTCEPQGESSYRCEVVNG